MQITWLESLLLGLVSGLAEFLPISAQAHRAVLLHMFGVSTDSSLLRFFTHGAVLCAIFTVFGSRLRKMHREQALLRIPARRRKRQPDQTVAMELRMLRGATIFMLLCVAFYFYASKAEMKLNVIAGILVLNGIILYVPSLLPQANKDARSMSRLDSVLLGLGAALSFTPGISAVGTTISLSSMRGADKPNSLRWAIVLMVPITVIFMGLDIYSMIAHGMGVAGFSGILMCLMSAVGAFAGAAAAIKGMQFLSEKAGFSGFAFYSWGAALFLFIIYLTT